MEDNMAEQQQNNDAQDKKGVKFPPQSASEGSNPPANDPVDRWIKKRAEEGAKKHNPLLDVKGGS
jgi:hypothetical protein